MPNMWQNILWYGIWMRRYKLSGHNLSENKEDKISWTDWIAMFIVGSIVAGLYLLYLISWGHYI